MAKSYNVRRAKLHRSYTVAEAACLFGITRGAVRAWIKAGLPVVTTSGPLLILGADLQAFLAKRQAARLRKCPPGTIYCLRCREPRRPYLATTVVVLLTATSGNLRACCPDCDAPLNRRVTLAKLNEAGFSDVPRQARGAAPKR